MIILVPTDKYNMQEIDQIEEIVENMGTHTTTEKISDVFTVSPIITLNESNFEISNDVGKKYFNILLNIVIIL